MRSPEALLHSMSNPDRDELLSAYLDGELASEEVARVQRLLAEDAAYRRLEKELREAQRRLGAIPREALGKDFHVGVLARIEKNTGEIAGAAIFPVHRDTDQAKSRYWGRPHDLRRMIGWPIVAAAAALLLLVSQRGAFEGQNPRIAQAPPTTADRPADANESLLRRPEIERLGSAEGRETIPESASGSDWRRMSVYEAEGRFTDDMVESLPSLRAASADRLDGDSTPAPAAGPAGYPIEQAEALADQSSAPEGLDASLADAKRGLETSSDGQVVSKAVPGQSRYYWNAQANKAEPDPTADPVLVIHVDVPSLRDGMSALTAAFANNSIQMDQDADANMSGISDLRPVVRAKTQTIPFVVEDATVTQINGALTELQNNARVVSNLLVVNDGTDVRSNALWNRRFLETNARQDFLVLGDRQDKGVPVDAVAAGGFGGGRGAEVKQGIETAVANKAARAYPADRLLDELSAEEQSISRDLYEKDDAVRGRRTVRLEELTRTPATWGKKLVEVAPTSGRLKAVFLLQSVEPAASPAREPTATPESPEP